jgi:aminotransferase
MNSNFKITPASRMEQLPSQFFVELVKKINNEVSQGHDVINIGQGNPDQPTPPHIVKALQSAAKEPKFHKYGSFNGFLFVKEAIAHRYKQDFNVDIDPETEVSVLFGSKTGLVEISQCLLNPGDVCLVPDPGYPDYWAGVSLAEAKMSFMPLLESNRYLPDYGAISEEDLAKAKLMFINYPNNPTGVHAPDGFYEETVRFAKQNGIVVASDNAYSNISFDGYPAKSFLQAPGAKEVGVEFYTLSKNYNMAGWRIAFAVGNSEVIKLIDLMQDHMHVSLFGGIQAAAAEALTGPQDCVKELSALYEKRRNTLFRALKRIGWHATPPEGSFFCWLPVPIGFTSESFTDYLLKEAKVVVAPGVGFGPSGEGYVRVALLTSEERLEEAVERIGKLNLF